MKFNNTYKIVINYDSQYKYAIEYSNITKEYSTYIVESISESDAEMIAKASLVKVESDNFFITNISVDSINIIEHGFLY